MSNSTSLITVDTIFDPLKDPKNATDNISCLYAFCINENEQKDVYLTITDPPLLSGGAEIYQFATQNNIAVSQQVKGT